MTLGYILHRRGGKIVHALPMEADGRVRPNPRLDTNPDGSVTWNIRPGDQIEICLPAEKEE